jgi:hypothetical protein
MLRILTYWIHRNKTVNTHSSSDCKHSSNMPAVFNEMDSTYSISILAVIAPTLALPMTLYLRMAAEAQSI